MQSQSEFTQALKSTRARACPFEEKGGRGVGRRGIGLGSCREGGQWLSKGHDREVIIELPLEV
jgi:hypothetical protein